MTMKLPGYECQMNDDSVKHSLEKVKSAAYDLSSAHATTTTLGSTTNTLRNNDGDVDDGDGDGDATDSNNNNNIFVLVPQEKIHIIPCTSYDETINYRCSCTFQIIQDNYEEKDKEDGLLLLQYAMRSSKTPIPIGSSHFPIATIRIQNAMKQIITNLNIIRDNNNQDDQNRLFTFTFTFQLIRSNLSSISFVSSWDNDKDCIVTFNYSKPLYDDDEDITAADEESSSSERISFQEEVTEFYRRCSPIVTTMIFRAKKMKEIIGRNPVYIDDVLHIVVIQKTPQQMNDNSRTVVKEVGLGQYHNQGLVVEGGRGDGSISSKNEEVIIPVIYHKPEDAFQHPNSNTMIQALKWMLNKLYEISNDARSNSDNDKQKSFRLLEMYCGCGAHTMAISKCQIFDEIIAIELDSRLVDACKINCMKNECSPVTEEENTTTTTTTMTHNEATTTKLSKPTPVYVFQGDATEWAKNLLRAKRRRERNQQQQQQQDGQVVQAPSVSKSGKQTSSSSSSGTSSLRSSKSYWYEQQYDVLLVDPPRMGLSQEVRDLVVNGGFMHLLYVSCGRKPLKGDLDYLLKHNFDVIDCTITDLFPRTNSVETLVHLKRKDNIR